MTQFPKHFSKQLTIEGNLTDIVFTEFTNKLFIIATQFEKFGTLIQVTQNVTQDSLNNSRNIVYDTQVLFGKDEVEIHAAARYLAESTTVCNKKPVLLSLGLKDYGITTVQELGHLFQNFK